MLQRQGHKSLFAGKRRRRGTGIGNEDGLPTVGIEFGVGMRIEHVVARRCHGHESNRFTRPWALWFWRSANHYVLSKYSAINGHVALNEIVPVDAAAAIEQRNRVANLG